MAAPAVAHPNSPTAAAADVFVRDMTSPDPASVRVGQTIGIAWPGGVSLWQVDFAPDELTLVTAPDQLSNPGPAGWVWRAVKTGTVEIVLTARAPCPSPPCDENPARYTVAVEIKR